LIYIVRHGQTNLNKEGRLQGSGGLPLNETGMLQAMKLRDQFINIKFDVVLSSPQERAIQTAEMITGFSPKIDLRLDVFDLGDADGLKREEVKFKGVVPDPRLYSGVEDVQSFIQRIFGFMNDLKSDYSNEEINILVSGHRCTTGCIGAYFKGIPKDGNILKYSSSNGDFNVYSFNQ